MRITLDKLILADHGRTAVLSDWSIDAAKAVQVDESVRAEQVNTRSRNNRQTTISFTTSRQHASFAAAVAFSTEHAEDALSKSGVLEIEEFKESGGPQKKFLRNAEVLSVRIRQVGVRTITSYQIIGGKVSSKAKDD